MDRRAWGRDAGLLELVRGEGYICFEKVFCRRGKCRADRRMDSAIPDDVAGFVSASEKDCEGFP